MTDKKQLDKILLDFLKEDDDGAVNLGKARKQLQSLITSSNKALLDRVEEALPPEITKDTRRNIYRISPEQEWYDKGQNDTVDSIRTKLAEMESEL